MDLEIKVCGMMRDRNIIDVSETCPAYMGFIFYDKSPRYVGNLNVSVLKEFQMGTEPVAVFVNSPIDYVINICRKYGFRIVQLHGDESPEYCEKLRSTFPEEDFRIWKAVSVTNDMDWSGLSQYQGVVNRFVFDTSCNGRGGSGKKFDWSQLESYNLDTPFMLSGGIGPGDAKEIAAVGHPKMVGVDLNSGFETSPGIKWVPSIREFQYELFRL